MRSCGCLHALVLRQLAASCAAMATRSRLTTGSSTLPSTWRPSGQQPSTLSRATPQSSLRHTMRRPPPLCDGLQWPPLWPRTMASHPKEMPRSRQPKPAGVVERLTCKDERRKRPEECLSRKRALRPSLPPRNVPKPGHKLPAVRLQAGLTHQGSLGATSASGPVTWCGAGDVEHTRNGGAEAWLRIVLAPRISLMLTVRSLTVDGLSNSGAC